MMRSGESSGRGLTLERGPRAASRNASVSSSAVFVCIEVRTTERKFWTTVVEGLYDLARESRTRDPIFCLDSRSRVVNPIVNSAFYNDSVKVGMQDNIVLLPVRQQQDRYHRPLLAFPVVVYVVLANEENDHQTLSVLHRSLCSPRRFLESLQTSCTECPTPG